MKPSRPEPGAHPDAPGLAALDATLLLLAALTLLSWFAAWPAGLPPALPLALLGLAALTRWASGGWRLRPPRLETGLCLVVASLYRLPALLHPWGWVNKDGAYGAFVTLHILQGVTPAPVFTEGANYQGTLKSQIAALLSLAGPRDLSFLMTAASALLSLVFLVASMALARRLAGRGAALVTGLYLALGPKFLTTFSLNCVGQYVDVLALGGVALAVTARILQDDRDGSRAGHDHALVGILLGAALWQQPVALCYVLTVGAVLLLRPRAWRWAGWLLAGLAVGLLPVLAWNLQHGWASEEILGRNLAGPLAVLRALPAQVARTVSISFPILAGLSPGHPWGWVPVAAAAAFPLVLLGAILALRGRELIGGLRDRHPSPSLLPPLLMVVCLLVFWSNPGELIHYRPRYLLPVMAATAVHLGLLADWAWRRSRSLTFLAVGALVAFDVAGTLPRLEAGAGIEQYYRGLVASLQDKQIRTGYADFSIAAPVTMFTAEAIVLSPALGPTPAHVSPRQARRVARAGPDAYLLLPQDPVDRFAAVLRELGVSYRFSRKPVPIFYDLSRRVPLREVRGFRGDDFVPPSERE